MYVFWRGAREMVLPTHEEWLRVTADNTWHGWRHHRSLALRRIDSALGMLETQPSARVVDHLFHDTRAWHASKDSAGRFGSRRGSAATDLTQSVKKLYDRLQDRNMLMDRISRHLDDALDWKRRILCAELYVDAANPRSFVASSWAPLTLEHVKNLAWEARTSSQWAAIAPRSVPEWSDRGSSEADSLAAWPNLPAGGSGRAVRSGIQARRDLIAAGNRHLADDNAPDNWPPWHVAGAPPPPHVRKGLFCHSCAALAAHVICENRLALEAGLDDCRIRSIDIIQQQPEPGGVMHHWWVCVNRPDTLRFSNRTINFQTLLEYDFLDLVGGFVIDIWGVLWRDQGQRPAAKAKDPAAASVDAVRARPKESILGDTATKIYARQVFY